MIMITIIIRGPRWPGTIPVRFVGTKPVIYCHRLQNIYMIPARGPQTVLYAHLRMLPSWQASQRPSRNRWPVSGHLLQDVLCHLILSMLQGWVMLNKVFSQLGWPSEAGLGNCLMLPEAIPGYWQLMLPGPADATWSCWCYCKQEILGHRAKYHIEVRNP